MFACVRARVCMGGGARMCVNRVCAFPSRGCAFKTWMCVNRAPRSSERNERPQPPLEIPLSFGCGASLHNGDHTALSTWLAQARHIGDVAVRIPLHKHRHRQRKLGSTKLSYLLGGSHQSTVYTQETFDANFKNRAFLVGGPGVRRVWRNG